jgi:hypothetical protein
MMESRRVRRDRYGRRSGSENFAGMPQEATHWVPSSDRRAALVSFSCCADGIIGCKIDT